MEATAKSRVAKAAAIVAESALFASLPSWHAEVITRILSGDSESRGTDISLDFRSVEAQTTVNFYVNTNSEGFETADNGDSYFIQRVSTSTSWPSHGSASPELNARRLAFMTQVNDLAARVSASIDGVVTTLYRTAAELEAERAERERQNAAAKLNRVVLDAICTVNKAMRVNGSRDIPKVLLPGVPNGTSTHSINGKKYELRVYEGFAKVERTV